MLDQLRTSPEIVYVIYIGIALGIMLIFTGIAQLASRGENLNEAKSRRMKMIAAGASTEEILAILKPDNSRGWMSRMPLLGGLPTLLRRAGISASPAMFLGICAALGFLVLIFAGFVLGPYAGLVAAVLIGFVAPIVALDVRARKHETLLISQLPDALDLMARGLRVGHPLNTSIQEVAHDMPDPIGTEFGIMFDQISFGDDLVDAFDDFAKRTNLEDIQYLSASVGIQHGTGGDLARIIQVLSNVVRGRITMRRRIMAISAEGRLTGIFLSLLPIFILASVMTSNPDYYLGVMESGMFRPLAITVVLLTVGNFLAIQKLVNFKV
ncbi:type II secretion system F family protein [Flavimaricola marinus]|uniref:Bacterial type II secretion system protein F domain protein n=1 Tax=Flavimaricola marinus TaxID=1819565 RepID=A0A238L9N7_9RHOB|nr:type II secretion system F family protein [Flavimaricola marinus]SMY06124.1 Bacterial type II secretion system protein F domain protein [Flavimaricola marinus]